MSPLYILLTFESDHSAIVYTPPLWRDLVKILTIKLWRTSSFLLEYKFPGPLLRTLRSPRSNNLETQNDENYKWKLIKNRWNPKFGLLTSLSFLNQGKALGKMSYSSAFWSNFENYQISTLSWWPRGRRVKIWQFSNCVPMKKMRYVTTLSSKFSLNLFTEEVCFTIESKTSWNRFVCF